MLQSMLAYKNAVDVTYSHAEQMSTLVEAAGKRCNIYSWTLYAPKLSLQKWPVRIREGRSASLAERGVLLELGQSQPLHSCTSEHRQKRQNPFFAAKLI